MGNWDSEIDDVARQMTEGGPDANVKARVLARIGAASPQPWLRRSVWTWSPVAVAAAAVLVLTIVPPMWKTETVRLKPDTARVVTETAGAMILPKPDASSTIQPNPENKYAATRADTSVAPTNRQAASQITSSPPSLVVLGSSRSTSEGSGFAGAVGNASGFNETRIATLVPSPIDVAPLGVELMETMAAIQVPTLAVPALDVPALAIALLEVPATGDQ
jgi:hypothetical protein